MRLKKEIAMKQYQRRENPHESKESGPRDKTRQSMHNGQVVLVRSWDEDYMMLL